MPLIVNKSEERLIKMRGWKKRWEGEGKKERRSNLQIYTIMSYRGIITFADWEWVKRMIGDENLPVNWISYKQILGFFSTKWFIFNIIVCVPSIIRTANWFFEFKFWK